MPMAVPRANGVPRTNGVAHAPKPRAASLPKASAPRAPQRVQKAASTAGDNPANGVTSAYAIMASRIANRVAEMAEGITFVERPKPMTAEEVQEKKKPRKLEMRLPTGSGDVSFSAPFLDNTLQKMLHLQNRMLQSTADLAKAEGVPEKVVKEQASQAAELSRLIALICAEKARQGA